jgi:hypothetical protein
VSQITRSLERCRDNIPKLLDRMTVGVGDNTRNLPKVYVVLERSRAWASTAAPKLWETGGSSTPSEDRGEARRVGEQALSDTRRILEICRELERLSDQLVRIVERGVATIDPSKYPTEPIPGCRSCARRGHWAPVFEKSKAEGLCRWCNDARLAFGQIPPEDAVDMLHRQGGNAAGRWMTKHVRCPSTFTQATNTVRCTASRGHDGGHENGGVRWENRTKTGAAA